MNEKSCLFQLTGNPVLVKYERKEGETKQYINDPEPLEIGRRRRDFNDAGEKENGDKGRNNRDTTQERRNHMEFDSESEIEISVRNEPLKEEDTKETNRMLRGPTGGPTGEMNEISRIDQVETTPEGVMPQQQQPQPPDGGWGWLVLAGSFVVMLLVSTVGPCFNMVFSPVISDLGISPSTTFWILGTFSLVWNVASPAVGPLTKEFGHRGVAMAGSFLISVGVIVSAFATSSWLLFVFFSFFGGLGAGILVTISNLIIPVYFTRRLGRANGILMTGTSIGLFTAPHLITYLQEEYTYPGATLILGAIFLNTCVSAAVFHPVAWHSSSSRRGVRRCHGGCVSMTKDVQLHQRNDPDGENSCFVNEKLQQQSRRTAIIKKPVQTGKRDGEPRGICNLLLRVARATILSLRILRSPPALIIALSCTLTMNGYVNFLVMVHTVIEQLHSAQASALCVSISGICNLVARLIVSAMTDCKWFDMRTGYLLGISLIATINLVFPFLNSLKWMMVVMGVWGCGVGAFMGLYNLVMIKYMGVKSLPSMFGAASLLNGLGFITIGPLLGRIKEITGAYDVSMWTLAAIECVCIVLWIFMPAAMSWQRRRASSCV